LELLDVDMKTILLPDERVVSTVIDVYLRILERMSHEEQGRWACPICAMRSFTSSSILDCFSRLFPAKQELVKSEWNRLKGKLSKSARRLLQLNEKMFENSVYLFVPLHHGDHWSLLALNNNTRCFYHLDSKPAPANTTRADMMVC
jgi:hypothetical protein